jgi:DNA modification methylase
MSVRILVGDVRDVLSSLDEDQFDCVITSPPYWGLRDYGVEGQIGMEATLGEHIEVLVDVFRLVRRVMKPQASLWLNYGDCYATSPNGRSAADTKAHGNDDRTFRDKPFSTVGPIFDRSTPNVKQSKHPGGVETAGRIRDGGVLKPKDLCMVANRLAIALQEDGWWVRSEIIWGKTNPMPDSSGRYRPSTAHEKIFLLTKSAKSFYDSEAVKLGRSQDEDSDGYPGSDGDGVRRRTTVGNRSYKMPDGWNTASGAHGSFHPEGREKGRQHVDKQRGHSRRHDGFNDRWDLMSKDEQRANGRLLRNYEPAPVDVWEMSTAPFKGAHFATFPPELVRRALTAGCPKGGHVLDPFGGAGTVGLVAQRMGIDASLIELNHDYADLARERVDNDGSRLKAMASSAKRNPSPLGGMFAIPESAE